MIVEHDFTLVALSIGIAMLAAYAALDSLLQLGGAGDRASRASILSSSALAMGMGVWAMQFVGILALQFPTPVHFDGPLTLLALMTAVIMCFFGLSLVRPEASFISVFGGAVTVGIGFIAMHYISLAAIILPANVTYDRYFVLASGAFVIVASIAAFRIAYNLTRSANQQAWGRKLFWAVLMGVNVAGMHYLGMAAVSWEFLADTDVALGGISLNPKAISLVAAGVTVVIVVITLRTAHIDRSWTARLSEETDRLKASEERFRAILQNVVDGIIVIDEKGDVQYFNPAAEQMFGYDQSEILGHSISTLMPEKFGEDHQAYIGIYLGNGEPPGVGAGPRELEVQRKDGGIVPIELSVSDIVQNHSHQIIGVVRHIGERKKTEERLQHLASHDPLTGLPNRGLFDDRLGHAIALAERADNLLGLLYIDLDGFKPINDTLGHEAGDVVLKVISQRLQGIVRNSDTVARIGGDEFNIIVENMTNDTLIHFIADRVRDSVAEPIDVNGEEVQVTASIGLAVYPRDGKDMPALVQKADQAMYSAKKLGKNRVITSEDALSR
jgi:diguanylate cyclase (GGDEF)-like protein/PAS domain S-box-containing protein